MSDAASKSQDEQRSSIVRVLITFSGFLVLLLGISWLVTFYFCQLSIELQKIRRKRKSSDYAPDYDLDVNRRWMKTLDENLTISDLILPGSHDAAALNLTSSIMIGGHIKYLHYLMVFGQTLGLHIEDISVPWSETQSLSVYDQLCLGARYLDLRAGWNGSAFVAFHTMQGAPFDTVLAEVARFLREEPSEVLVVEVAHIFNAGPVERAFLAALVQQHLGPFLPPRAPPLPLPSLGQLRAANHRVVLTFEDPTERARNPSFLDPDRLLYNTWANTDRVDKLWNFSAQVVQRFNTRPRDDLRLWKLTWTLNLRPRTLGRYFAYGKQPDPFVGPGCDTGETPGKGPGRGGVGRLGPGAADLDRDEGGMSPARRRLQDEVEAAASVSLRDPFPPVCQPVALGLLDQADYANAFLPAFLQVAGVQPAPAVPDPPIPPAPPSVADPDSKVFYTPLPLDPRGPLPPLAGSLEGFLASVGPRVQLPQIVLFDRVETAAESIAMLIAENKRRTADGARGSQQPQSLGLSLGVGEEAAVARRQTDVVSSDLQTANTSMATARGALPSTSTGAEIIDLPSVS